MKEVGSRLERGRKDFGFGIVVGRPWHEMGLSEGSREGKNPGFLGCQDAPIPEKSAADWREIKNRQPIGERSEGLWLRHRRWPALARNRALQRELGEEESELSRVFGRTEILSAGIAS